MILDSWVLQATISETIHNMGGSSSSSSCDGVTYAGSGWRCSLVANKDPWLHPLYEDEQLLWGLADGMQTHFSHFTMTL